MTSIARRIAIPVFVLVFSALVAIDTYPAAWATRIPYRQQVYRALCWLGLQQGDWPLFAPNPGMREGIIVGDILDDHGNTAIWNSTDWSKATVWEKFYRFRHLNYTQRVIQNSDSSKDLADYLQRAIPERENIVPGIRWSDDDDPLISDPIQPPIRQIVLYHHLQRIILSPDEPLPRQSEILWGQKSTFLVRRDYKP